CRRAWAAKYMPLVDMAGLRWESKAGYPHLNRRFGRFSHRCQWSSGTAQIRTVRSALAVATCSPLGEGTMPLPTRSRYGTGECGGLRPRPVTPGTAMSPRQVPSSIYLWVLSAAWRCCSVWPTTQSQLYVARCMGVQSLVSRWARRWLPTVRAPPHLADMRPG